MSGLELLGAAVGAAGSLVGGIQANQQAKYEQQQLNAKAKEETAASQRDAIDKRREAALVNSRQQALAAASGAGGAETPTIAQLMESTAGQGEYNALGATYGGEQRARGLVEQGKASRMSGRAALTGGLFSGGATLLSGPREMRRSRGLGNSGYWG